MTMKILAWSNAVQQPTGYATCQRELIPRINERSDHEIVQLAASGIKHSMVTTIGGVKVYPQSSRGGELSHNDVPVVCEREDVDLVWTQFDAWYIPNQVTNLMDAPKLPPFAVYAPIDHDPIAPNWGPILNNAAACIPYCDFGERVMLEAGIDPATVADPIYHGVDVDAFQPRPRTRERLEAEGRLDEDTFVVGHFKNNQGSRSAHDRALAAFRDFLDREDAWDDAKLYLHCSIRGDNSFDIANLVHQNGLGDNVLMTDDAHYRWGVAPEQLARYYSVCDVLLNNVRGEGFGIPMLEAMACEVPVIGGAYSSMPELIAGEEGEISWRDVSEQVVDDHVVIDAERGWLVPTWDVEMSLGKHSWRRRYNRDHLVDALADAYTHPEKVEDRGAAGRSFAEQHTWDHKAREFIELFDALEADLWERDEDLEIDWETVGEAGDELGGVGAFGGS